jgi:hypothetical protein
LILDASPKRDWIYYFYNVKKKGHLRPSFGVFLDDHMMLLVYGVDDNPAPVDRVHVAELRVLLDTHAALEDVNE